VHDGGVRFQAKDLYHGKDVRIWHVIVVGGKFTAEAINAF
jgi:hypothetical protein